MSNVLGPLKALNLNMVTAYLEIVKAGFCQSRVNDMFNVRCEVVATFGFELGHEKVVLMFPGPYKVTDNKTGFGAKKIFSSDQSWTKEDKLNTRRSSKTKPAWSNETTFFH